MARRQNREEMSRVFSLPNSSWTPWYTALKPRAPNNSQSYEPREEGDHGVIYKEIGTRFQECDDGIYELRVSREGVHYVVYVGAAHRQGPGSLSKRIREYCWGGSHKDELINRAMRLGYTLSVRVQNIPRGNRKFVYECEDKYLEKYDYAWNKRNNGSIRENVPPR